MVMCALFTALIAIGAFIQIPIPFMDYFTLQFLFVMLAGILLGSKLGGLSVLLYVCIGLFGLPIFAAGGGLAYIVRPSFGYLLGFIAGAYVCGFVQEKLCIHNYMQQLIPIFAGLLTVYVIGLGYKYMIYDAYLGTPMSWKLLVLSCFPIDLPGDIALSLFAGYIGIRMRHMRTKGGLLC